MQKEPWQIAAARFCVENAETGTNTPQLTEHLREKGYKLKRNQIAQFWDEEIMYPAGRRGRRSSFDQTDTPLWQPPLDLVQKITDYDEMKLARKTAAQASIYSFVAIGLAIGSIFVTIFYTQTVKVENIPRSLQTSYFVAQ